MLFGKKAKDHDDSDDITRDKIERLQAKDEQNKADGKSNHVEAICHSKGRELHHDRANMKHNKNY